MKKLLTRGLYLFAIMLFAVGGIFVAGATANDTVSVAESGSASQNVDIGNAETWEKWSDVSVQIDPFTTQTYFGQTVNVIDSAEDLAALSYYVQEGNTTYASAYYLVTADINLIGKLWTPIGTSTNPFSGQFYGGGHTISGIVVSEASAVAGSGVGLFGNVSGSLVDVVVDDLVVLNQSDASMTGALVGHLSATAEVLNCYDLRANKTTYSSIGTAGNNTKIYRGGSVDGVSADYTSQTAIYNAMTINTNGDKTSTRYTIQYRVTDSNARFEKYGDSAWGTSGSDGTQTKVVKVALDGENGTIREVKAFAFSNNIPVLRHQAEGKNDQVYVINEGNRATIPSNSLSTGLVTTINFTATTTTLTVNYGYGTNPGKKIETKNIDYDTPWKQYFDLTRIGFNLDGAYQNYDEDSDQFSNPFGSEYIETLSDGGSATLYLKWAATTHNLTFRLGWSGDIENDISDNGSGNAHLPYTNFGYNGFTATPNTAVYDRYFWSVDGQSHTAGTNIEITFTLKDGYTFANPTYNDVEVVPDLSGTGIVIDNPGVQTSFAEGNIDNWQPTKYSIVKDGDDYTVTFKDVVADGQIVLLFEQKEIKVEMLAVTWDGDISHDPIASTEFSYEIKNINGNDQNITQENPFSVKSGDSFSLVGTANSGYYITGMQIFAGTNNLVYDSVTNTQVTTPSWLSVALEDTFQVANEDNDEYPISYRIQALQSEDGVQSTGIIQIALFLGTLPIYIQVNEPTFSSGEANPYYPTLPGISAGGGETTNSILEITNAKENGENVTFELTFDGEGVYTLDSATLTNASVNITQPSAGSTAQTIEITMNKDDAYGKVLNLNYTIHANTYNLSSAVTIDGDTPSSDFGNYQLVFSKTENDFSDTITTAMPGDTIYWKLTMIDNAYTKRIAFSGVTVKNGANAENSTYEDFTISGSFTAGTSDVSVNVAFNTVTLTFTPSTNTMYIDNFNGLGSEVFVNTNVSNTIEGALSATGGQGKYTVNVSTLTSISIYKGYYLVGWYIQNGETKIVGRSFNTDEGVQDFFNDLFSQDNFLSAVSGGTTSFTLVPIYRQKTITVTGAFAETDGLPTSNDGGSTWDGGEYTLSNTYYFIHNFSIDDEVYSFSIDISDIKANMRKAGYEQATSWNFASSTGVWTDDKPAPTNYGLAIGGDAVSIGASNGNMQGVDVWGSATEATLTINPVFGEKIAYGITIDGVNGDSTSSISIGDTITFTSEGVYKISEQKVFTDTASDGYHFSGITLEGNNSGTSEFAELSGENTTITLTVDIFKNLVAENGYITDRNIFTVATNEEANTYKIYLGYENGAETVDEEGLDSDNGGFYVEVTFGQEASALATFTTKITRNGYTLVGFRERVSEGGVQYATYADGAWTYEVFNPEPAEDTTVYAVWQVKDEKYVSATLQGFTPYFNENDQVVIQGTVLAGENEIADGTTPVGNGETITNVIIALSGTESEAAAGFSAGRQIVLRNVAGEQTYIMIVTITDTLSANRFGTNEGYTYQIRSNTASGNILANAIVVEGAQIETYYTGSSAIAETANSIRGTLAFEHAVTHGDQPVTPNLSVENATITIGGAEFGVAEGCNAIYDFNLDATQGANYGITASQGGKYLIVVNGVLDIVPIELQFNMEPETQTGFYMQGLYHRANIGSVTAYDKDNNELVSKFNFNTQYNYVRTNSDAVASYTADQFVIDGLTVSIGDTAVDPENYIWTVVGTYNIADSEDVANIFSYDARYLTATNGKLNINSGNLELTYGGASRIFNVTYIIDGQRTVVQGNQVSVADTTGDTLFTIIGNNTSSLSIAVKIDASVTFEISVVGEGGDNLAFLGYFTAAQVALWTPNMVSQLDNFTQEASNVSTLTLTTGSQAEERLAVYTDARAVNVFNNTDGVLVTNASPSSKFYISSGDNTGYALGNPTMTGFTFNTWSLSSNEVSIEKGDGSYTFKSSGGSTPVRAIGRWTLDVPALEEVKTLFDYFATEKEGVFVLDNTDVARLTNNSGLVTYTWTWKKGDDVLGTGNRWNFGRQDTSINGHYSLSVTANYTDINGTSGSKPQDATSREVQFEIAIKPHKISDFALTLKEMTYSNADLEKQIILRANVNGEIQDIGSVYDGMNSGYNAVYITVAYGEGRTPVSHVRNAGTYYITLEVDDTIYDLTGENTLEFTVLQDEIILTQEDVKGLTKEFGASDPALTINYSINLESVPITLTRKAGESVGNHAFATASTTNANYTIADVSGLNFVITPATYALQVSLDSTISYTYNKLAVTSITAKYVGESKDAWFTSAGWYLYAYNDGTLLAVTRVSLFVNSTAVTTEIEHALDGFIFAPSSAGAGVGTYGLADISGTSTTYTRGAEFVGSVPQASAIEVTPKELVITSIEKTFDQSSTATWTSTGDNTGLDVQFQVQAGVLEGDEVQIRIEFADAEVGIKKGVQVQVVGNGNYTVSLAESAVCRVIPSDANVEVTIGTSNTFVYGTFASSNMTNTEFLRAQFNTIKITADSSTIAEQYLENISAMIEGTVSKGNFLVAGGQELTITLTSRNYTFGVEDTDLDGIYEKEFTLDFTVKPASLSLSQTPTVTKEYDGTANLSSTYEGAQVGTSAPSVWIGTGLLAGDIVTISGKYDSADIGARTLSLTAGGADGANYSLTGTPAGQIASVEFDFTGHLDTEEWVEDGVDAPQNNSFSEVFDGNYSNFANAINDESNFGSRVGYTQTGWTFTADDQVYPVDADHADELVSSLLAGGNQITLDAVWEQNDVTITVNYNQLQGSVVGGEGVQAPYSVPYFTGSLTLSVTANNGYFFETYLVTGNAQHSALGTDAKNGTISISQVREDITVQVDFALITISITANDGSHPDVELAGDSDRWTDAHEFNITNATGTVATTLPQYTLAEKSYILSGWTFKIGNAEAVVVDADDPRSIWKIIDGDGLTGNSLSVTVTALWEVDSISFTITHNNATIKSVKVGDEPIVGEGDRYTVHFGDTVVVVFEGNEGYKFSSFNLSGKAEGTTPANTGKRTNTSITMTGLKQDGAILTINMTSIVITINTEANTQPYSQVSGSTTVQYQINHTDLTGSTTLNEEIDIFKTTQTGTYNQTSWTYGKDGQSVALGDHLLDFIKSTYASENPLKEGAMLDGDYPLKESLIAVWTAVEYTITLDDNDKSTTPELDPIRVSYGGVLNFPELTPSTPGDVYTWNTSSDGRGTTYQNGDKFQTPNTSVSDGATTATSTIYAVWTVGNFHLTINWDKQITSVSYRDADVTEGQPNEYPSGTTITFDVTLEDGYVIDEAQTNAGDSGLTISPSGDQIMVANMTDDATLTATLNIVSKPETFRLNLDLRNGVESVSGAQQDSGTYYVNIDYLQAYNDTALSSLVFTRTGYTPSRLMLGETPIATYAEGAWTVVGDTYTFTTDSTIDVEWTRNDGYYTVTMEDQKNDITYSAQDQTVANGKVTVGGVAYNLGDILPNGDIYVRYFFERQGGSQTADGTSSLVLRNVNQYGQYRFVLEIRDGVTNELVQLASDWAQFTISKAEMSWSKDSFTSYYSGTSNFYATTPGEDMGHALIGVATVNDATFGRVIFTGSDYNVGSDKDVRVYINITADLAANYSNIQGGSTSGYYLALTGAGEIVATPISFAITGGGFQTGTNHEIVFRGVGSDKVTTSSGVPLDAFTFSVTFVTDGTTGAITSFNVKENSNSVLLSGRGVDKDNFIWNGTGTYTITAPSKTITISGKKFSANDAITDASITLSLSNLSYNTEIVDLGQGDFYNHVVEGNAVFTISGNGSGEIVIALGSGVNFKFDVTTSRISGFGLLGWTDDITIATLKTTLQTLPKEDDYLQSYSSADIENIYAVYTDLKYVRANYGYGENQGADYYVQIGQSTTLTEPERTGFNFVRWQAGAGVSVEGDTLSVASGETILPSSVTAIWEIADPTTATNNKKLAFDAEYGANKEITLADVAGSIKNQSSDLTYKYRWLKDSGEIAGNVDNISIVRNITANGDYTLEITASLSGYTSKTTIVNFKVTINRINLTAGTISSNSGTYKHADYAGEITIPVTVGSEEKTPYTISSHLAKENFWFEVRLESEEVSQIFSAGTYTISLHGDSTVYNDPSYQTTFTVNVYTYELTSDDVTGLGKYFGDEDPDPITVTKVFTFGADNTESVQINFTRVEDGEAVGKYEVEVASISPTGNYSITAPEGNDFFEIRRSEGRLNITFDSPEALTKVYNGATSSISVTFDREDQKWTLSISDSASTTVSSGLTLKVFNAGREEDLTGTALENALSGITFTFGEGVSAKNANSYPISLVIAEDGSNYPNAQITNATSFVITKANLVVSGITKEFDRTNSFSQAISGVGGEKVTVTGQFAQVTVGSGIELNSVAILASETDNVNNYTISEIQTGSITPSSETNFTFIAGEDEFTYGDLRADDSLQTILEKLGEGSRFTIGGDYTGAIEEGYAQITSAVYGTKTVSTGGYLIAGGNTITLTITSANYAQLASGKTFEVSISIDPKALDLSGTQITKQYDKTTALPDGIVWSIEGLLFGDNVTVDEEASVFANSTVGNHRVNIALTAGQDASNYSLAEDDMPMGNITPNQITLVVDGETLLNRDFSSIAKADGESINIPSPSFNVEYTDSVNGDSILGSFRAPTRTGFTASGWYYLSGKDYIQITGENMQTVLDGAFDTNKTMTIYAGWTIDKLQITLSVQNATASVSAEESAKLVDNHNGTYSVNYFSTITVKVTGAEGYKLDNITYSGNAQAFTPTGVGTKNNGQATISQIRTGGTITITMEEIMINVTVNGNTPAFVDEVTLSGEGWDDYAQSIAYNDAGVQASTFLPQWSAPAGTYNFAGYTYGEGTPVAEQTLQDIVGQANEDVNISFTASWTGVKYSIHFNVTENGSLEGSDTTTDLVFGQELDFDFPVATLSGRVSIWNTSADGEGRVYGRGSYLQDVGTLSQDVYVLELYTVWANRTSTLTINVGENVTRVLAGRDEVTPENKTFELEYGVDSLIITITLKAGYELSYDYPEEASNEIVVSGNTITISNMADNRELRIQGTARTNTLTLNMTNAIVEKVTSGTQGIGVVTAPTGDTVSITFAPTKGYSFVDGQSTISLSGRGKIQSTYQDGKVTVTWSDFTGDASLTVSSTPNKNEVTFSDNSAKVTSIWANSQSVNVAGGSVSVRTGESLTIVVNLRYGYHNASLTLQEGATASVSPQEETFDDETKTYRRTFVVSGIDENLQITITSEEREYRVQSISENADLGSVTSEDVVTMRFGSSSAFGATANEGYVFAGWYIGDTLISTDNPYTFFANESVRTYLENNLTDGVLQLIAHFGLAESEVSITNGANGTLTYNWGGDDDQDRTLIENDSTSGIVSFGNNLVIRVTPHAGYSVTSDTITFTKEGQPVPDAWAKYVQPDENGGAVITIPVEAGVPDRIEVTYVANDIDVYVQGILRIALQRNYGTNVGGQILLADEDGTVVDWTTENTYLDPNDEIGLVEGANYRLAAKTDDTLYFIARINEGYTFTVDTSSIAGMQNAVINEIRRTDSEVFFSISRVSEGLRINGTFVANSNLVTVKFQTEDGVDVPAGSISVDTSSALVNAPINNGSNIYFYAVTSANATLTINLGFNYSLKMNGEEISASISESLGDNVTFGEITDPGFTTGYTQRVTMNINAINANGEIIIYVTPKVYNLNFVSEGVVLASISGITYGQALNIPQEVLSQILVAREGYTLQGYYTFETGQGTRYVNADGSVPTGMTWLESGYTWNGTTYVVSPNFNQNTQTFSLYASWSFDKEKVTIDFIPPELKGLVDISIKDIIYNLGADTSWTYANDKYYAEILEGVEIGLRAYPFEGFTFVKWIVNRDGQELTHTTEEINYISEAGEVTISAVYRLNFTLSVENVGGTVSLWQDGTNLGANGAFDPSKDISLVASENRGYNFVGWFTADGEAFGEKGTERVNADGTSTWTYTFTPSLQPLSLKAVFEGDEVGIIVDTSGLTGLGSIVSFRVNGAEQDISSEITAHVGSQIQIQVESEYGYGVIWEGVTPRYDIASQTYFYTVLAEDLTSYDGALHSSVILLRPVGTSTNISFRFDVRMEEDSQSIENAGTLTYRDAEGNSHNITTGSLIEGILYGNTFFLEVALQPNYRVGYVAIVSQGIHILDYDTIGSGFNPVSSRIEIQTSILNEYKPDLGEAISIIVNFERDVWTDYRVDGLSGEGTEASPFIIATREDLAYMAYMINDEGNEYYASAYYLLVDNLDMDGRFWEPIGTEENPFSGTFNFDVYSIENLEHYMVYSNPTTSYNGLFWFMTEDAQILITNNALIIGLSVAGGIILLILLILLIILLVRRRNKKKMEELANS